MVSKKQVKAIGLLSGGLDSPLAIKLVLEQGIQVIAVTFVLPFSDAKRDYATDSAKSLGVPLIKVESGDEYIELVKNPKHGHGKNMNPCIDCHIYMLKGAKHIASEQGADFVITGDVLGERPMSQYKAALKLMEEESGLEGLILRPLSARLLPETVPEREGLVDRNRLLAIEGRSRKPQLALVREFGVEGFRPSGGGCLLTNREFSKKLRELFQYKERITKRDTKLLKVGRHFYNASSHIIVGRNEKENQVLLDLKNPEDCILEVVDCPGPITLLEGEQGREAVEFAAELTARYSDAAPSQVSVECRKDGYTEIIQIRNQKA